MPSEWKKPNRPSREITQGYADGIVKIYTTADSASPGRRPVVDMTLRETLRYENQRLGINRYYAALQNQIKISRVIRCPARPVTTQDLAETEDGKTYRIDMVQSVPGVYPASMDLTLVDYDQGVQ